MAKYLRSIAAHQEPEIVEAFDGAGVAHLFAMYQHYATPLRSDGCGKLNVWFRNAPSPADPSLLLDVAIIERHFDLKAFLNLPSSERPRRVLDEFHTAVMSAGAHYGWDLDRALDAHALIISKGLRFHFVWNKPKQSPNRRFRVQVEVDFTDTVRLDVVFLCRDGEELLRKPISVLSPGLGGVAFVLKRIEWIDSSQVKITHANGRDFWICGLDGTLEFHHARAESGDSHGMFDLGRMYCEGRYVLRDTELGRQWMELAAQKGYRHAVNYLCRTELVLS
jgi:hypothetical protein